MVIYKGICKPALDYSPYGDHLRSWSDVSPTYQFAGRQWPDTTGLYLSVTRPYDPVLGRFIQRDPIREAGGINLYGYVGGNPVRYVDPLGLDVLVVLYPGFAGFGHLGIAVIDRTNTIGFPGTTGFYAARGASHMLAIFARPVAGDMRSDDGIPIEAIVIPTTKEQDKAVQDFINDRWRKPGSYDLNERNCATTVGDALRNIGFNIPALIFPRDMMEHLRGIPGAYRPFTPVPPEHGYTPVPK